jgi:hypothetical protein
MTLASQHLDATAGECILLLLSLPIKLTALNQQLLSSVLQGHHTWNRTRCTYRSSPYQVNPRAPPNGNINPHDHNVLALFRHKKCCPVHNHIYPHRYINTDTHTGTLLHERTHFYIIDMWRNLYANLNEHLCCGSGSHSQLNLEGERASWQARLHLILQHITARNANAIH